MYQWWVGGCISGGWVHASVVGGWMHACINCGWVGGIGRQWQAVAGM